MSVRVLHVFSTFAPGGPQVRTARLLPELERGWEHAILALDGCTDARALLAPELAVEVTLQEDDEIRAVIAREGSAAPAE